MLLNKNCLLFDPRVAVIKAREARYPVLPPFEPDEVFPELGAMGIGRTDPSNCVYRAVRDSLQSIGLDAGRFGSPEWNPLGDLIKPGHKVVIKPNFVLHHHRAGRDVLCVIVHASVLRPILDYVQIALKGEGEVMVGDAPVTDADFDQVAEISGIRRALELLNPRYPIRVTLRDWRRMVVFGYEQNNLFLKRVYQSYGSAHSRIVNIGDCSELAALGGRQRRFYGADFDRRVIRRHHHDHTHEYAISGDILEADAVISVPKLKTHKSAGVTLNVKNMVGINTDKNFVPHYLVGEPCEGGDEFPDSGKAWTRFRSRAARFFLDWLLGRMGPVFTRPMNLLLTAYRFSASKRSAEDGELDTADYLYRHILGRGVRSGHWWGNDTLWRVGADLTRILLYGDKEGQLKDVPQRTYLSIVDGIIGGEGRGPMVPRPREAGVIVAGYNPLLVDYAAAVLMGFSPARIPIVDRVMRTAAPRLCLPGVEPRLRSNVPSWDALPDHDNSLKFKPAPNWMGQIESSRYVRVEGEEVTP